MAEEKSKVVSVVAGHESGFVEDGKGDDGEENERRVRGEGEVEENQSILNE